MKDIFLLDLDDTLVDFQRAEKENLKRLFKSLDIKTGEREYVRFHEINDGLWKSLERGEIQRSEIVTKRFELLFEEFGIQADVQTAADGYFLGLADICFPFEGAHAFLQKLKGRGKLYLTTNGASLIQRRHIEDGGFAPYFDDVFISDEIGCNKPLEGYSRYVVAHIPDYSGERAVYFGDSLTSDKLCAERMGAEFILFSPRGGVDYNGKTARNYDEALKLAGIL